FPNNIEGKFIALTLSLMLLGVNLFLLKGDGKYRESIFIKANKSTATTDLFKALIIFLTFLFAYINDHL
ncbi:MAG: hypothetical protein NWQ26_07915, partial [Paraglaciecola sp.]|nr:hypothetical protein [Paraglaciecola sp.]